MTVEVVMIMHKCCAYVAYKLVRNDCQYKWIVNVLRTDALYQFCLQIENCDGNHSHEQTIRRNRHHRGSHDTQELCSNVACMWRCSGHEHKLFETVVRTDGLYRSRLQIANHDSSHRHEQMIP